MPADVGKLDVGDGLAVCSRRSASFGVQVFIGMSARLHLRVSCCGGRLTTLAYARVQDFDEDFFFARLRDGIVFDEDDWAALFGDCGRELGFGD